MKGFFITIKNGLLEPKHVEAMGGNRNIGTIWLFLWLLDKMTKIDTEKGEGLVLGGKPIKYEEVKKDLGMSRATYRRWIDMLRDGGYISTKRTPYGLVITVYRAFKVFNQKVDKKPKKRCVTNEPSVTKKKERCVVGEPSRRLLMSHPDVQDKSHLIRQYKRDNTKETILATNVAGQKTEPINDFISLFENVNPSFEVLFKNKTQRAASERLLKKFGLEAMRKTLLVIEKTNTMQYAPVITTPVELERNGGKLKAFLAKENQNKLKNQIVSV